MTELSKPNRAYRAICFDLDGTLLPMELEEFLGGYFGRLGEYAAEHGEDPEQLLNAVNVGVKAMTANPGDTTNAKVFWSRFAEAMGPAWEGRDWEAFFSAFYEGPFGEIGKTLTANPAAARAVRVLRAKGYPLVLTTMPLFPREAVEWRLRWAGVDPADFERITVFDNSHSAKPHLEYYRENVCALGVPAEEVLMVGNNTVEDLAFCKLGADAFLVTDCLLDPVDFDLSTVRHGSLEEFADWAEGLPACENPATGIEPGIAGR